VLPIQVVGATKKALHKMKRKENIKPITLMRTQGPTEKIKNQLAPNRKVMKVL
jgi:hypothetical protein